MENFKGVFESKGVWVGIVTLLSGVAGMFGYVIDGDLQNNIVGVALALVAAVGGALGVYSRIVATKQLGTAP